MFYCFKGNFKDILKTVVKSGLKIQILASSRYIVKSLFVRYNAGLRASRNDKIYILLYG